MLNIIFLCNTKCCTKVVYNENMRLTPIVEDETYHIYNRGNQKQTLFRSERDYARMLFLILFFQSPETFRNIGRQVDFFVNNGFFDAEKEKVISDRFVELINFCLMPNHFHMTVRNVTDDGIPTYLHRIQNAYGRYFNTRYEKTGHVFQGTYKAKRISSDGQLQHLSAYIHKNPKEIKNVKSIEDYPWSSYPDHVQQNRWGNLIVPDIILGGYTSKEKYKNFVKTSTAKELDNNFT